MESQSATAVTMNLMKGTPPKYYKAVEISRRKLNAIKMIEQALMKSKSFDLVDFHEVFSDKQLVQPVSPSKLDSNHSPQCSESRHEKQVKFSGSRSGLENYMCGDLNATLSSVSRYYVQDGAKGSGEKLSRMNVSQNDRPPRKHIKRQNSCTHEKTPNLRSCEINKTSSSLVDLHEIQSRQDLNLSFSDVSISKDDHSARRSSLSCNKSCCNSVSRDAGYRWESAHGITIPKKPEMVDKSTNTTEAYCRCECNRNRSANNTMGSSGSLHGSNYSKDFDKLQQITPMEYVNEQIEQMVQTSPAETFCGFVGNGLNYNSLNFQSEQMDALYQPPYVYGSNSATTFVDETAYDHDWTPYAEMEMETMPESSYETNAMRYHSQERECSHMRYDSHDTDFTIDFSEAYDATYDGDIATGIAARDQYYYGTDELCDHESCLEYQNYKFNIQLWQNFQTQQQIQFLQWQNFQFLYWQQLQCLHLEQFQREQNEELIDSQTKRQKPHKSKSLLNSIEKMTMITEEEEISDDILL